MKIMKAITDRGTSSHSRQDLMKPTKSRIPRITSFILITLFTKTCLLNLSTVFMCISFFGLRVTYVASSGLQASSNSNWIWGNVPLARVLRVLSFSAHHFLLLFFMLSKGTHNLPGISRRLLKIFKISRFMWEVQSKQMLHIALLKSS